MANIVRNKFTIRNSSFEMLAQFAQAFNNGGVFETFLPTPPELLKAGAPVAAEIAAVNVAQYGQPDWYHWRLKNWGTKWDITACDGDRGVIRRAGDELIGWFESPWSPPLAGLVALGKSGFSFDLVYQESDMGFCGMADNTHHRSFRIDYRASATEDGVYVAVLSPPVEQYLDEWTAKWRESSEL